METQNFSVCMSVYKNDDPVHFIEAIESIMNQTVKPNEIVLTIDGPILSKMEHTIQKLAQEYSCMKLIWLKENVGLGNALAIGIKCAKYDIIARMDSDDIAVPYRFEKQLACFQNNNEISVISGSIYEFVDSINNIVGIRECPKTDVEIKKYLMTRCPLNHVTVMFKKEHVLKAGNYIDCKFNEDYHLWVRMALYGYKFMNLQENLVFVRVSKKMYSRRGGLVYFKSEALIQKMMLNNKIINTFTYCLNISSRFIIQMLLPNSIREFGI